MHAHLCFALFGAAAFTMPLQDPPEFGAVRWGRKLEPALEASLATKKPVLLLFQEVPG